MFSLINWIIKFIKCIIYIYIFKISNGGAVRTEILGLLKLRDVESLAFSTVTTDMKNSLFDLVF